MKELTVTMNAQITFIKSGEDDWSESRITAVMEQERAKAIKEDTMADDVVVSDMKLFIMDKENNDGK